MVVKIPNNYVKWIKVDSDCKLESKSFLGALSIVFSGGKGRIIQDEDKFFLLEARGWKNLLKTSSLFWKM